MKSRAIIITSLWGTSLATAFFLGKGTTPTPKDDAPATALATKTSNLSQSPRTESGKTLASTSSAQARLQATLMVQKDATPAEILTDIIRHEDAIERNNALLALIDNLASEDFLAAIDSFRNLGITRSRWGEYEMLLTAWAKVNPSEALDYSRENTEGPFASNTVLATWATTDPDAALSWALANHDNAEEANPWLLGVIEGIAPSNTSRATELMETLPRSQERGAALRAVAAQLLAQNPEDAKTWSASIEDEGLRAGAYAYTAQSIARNDPSAAAQWLTELGDVDALNRASEGITRNWYRDSPEEATAWVTSLPPEAMSEAAEGIVSQVVRKNPVEAAEYLSELAQGNPTANFDSSIRELVRGSTRQDPELAALWVSGLSNNEEQTRYYHRVLGQWSNRDSSAAEEWIELNSPELPDSIRRRFLPQTPQQ